MPSPSTPALVQAVAGESARETRRRLEREAGAKWLADKLAAEEADDFQLPSKEEMQRQIDQEEQERRKLTHPFESEPKKQDFFEGYRELSAILEAYKSGNGEDAKQIFKAKAHFMYGMDTNPLCFYTFFIIMRPVFEDPKAKLAHKEIIKHIPGDVRIPVILKDDSTDAEGYSLPSYARYDVTHCSSEVTQFSMDLLKSFIKSLEQKYPRLFQILEKNNKYGGILADNAIILMMGGLHQLHKTEKLESILNPEGGKLFDLKDFFVRLLEKDNNPFSGKDFVEFRQKSLDGFYQYLEKELCTPEPEKKSGNLITNLFNFKKKQNKKEEAIPLPPSYFNQTFNPPNPNNWVMKKNG
jgi:hypothetical protein